MAALRSLPASGSLAVSTGASQSQQLIRGDRGLMTMSDDTVMMKQIQATHVPDGRVFDVKALLRVVEDILNRATPQVDAASLMVVQAQAVTEDKIMQANFIAMLEALSYIIDRVACELSCKALIGSEIPSITVSILNILTSYEWEAKLVLSLAAFSLLYGEFWLLAQIYSTNQLAKSMALLKQLPSIFERGSGAPIRSRFDALNKLIRTMMDVTRCVVTFKDLPTAYISSDDPALSTALALIPTAVYWTIRSTVLCATHISSLTTLGIEVSISTSEAWELSTLAHKLTNIYEHLSQQLQVCNKYIEDKMNQEAYQTIKELLKMIHIDNMKVLKALIYPRDDILPLFDGSTKRRVGIEVLRRKNVLLLISGLDMSPEEISILEQIYNESRIHVTRMESQYEVVWIPIVDRSIQWTDSMQKQFENLQSTMPWYTIHSPLLIEKAVIQFIREEWHFSNKPILVVLDPQGRVVSPNAIHMMWIWGSNAFPFTSSREEELWRFETWRLELLVDGIDPTILTWIKDEKYIFLYGGEDIEWARKFTNTARSVAEASRIPLEILYVGKSSKKEQVRRVIATIVVEKLSNCWQDPAMIWFFWTRLESMLFSKIQLGKADERDIMMQEIKRLLSYDKEGSWAILSKGSNVVVNGHGATVATTLVEYDLWKDNVPTKGFDIAIQDHHKKLHMAAYPCSRFEFPLTTGRIPDYIMCPECHHSMEKFTTFRCCHEEGIANPDSTH